MMTLKEEGEDLLQGGYIREASNTAYQQVSALATIGQWVSKPPR
jgi:hypothetical protein